MSSAGGSETTRVNLMTFMVRRSAEAGDKHVVEDHRLTRTHTLDYDSLAGKVTAALVDDFEMVWGLELLCDW